MPTIHAPTHEEIQLAAYHRWLSNGCPQGQPDDDWQAAETYLWLNYLAQLSDTTSAGAAPVAKEK